MSTPTFLDLFCGAGGLSLGLKLAGLTPSYSVDLDVDCVNTLSESADHDVIQGDVLQFLEKVRSRKILLPKVFLLAGGPPCQGFCSINPHRSASDPRNSLVDTFLYGVEVIQPDFVLMENVTGLLSLAGGKAIRTVEDRLLRLGYRVDYRVLQAAHYGVPQSRWRLVVLGSKRAVPDWPSPTHAANLVPNFIRGKELTFKAVESDLFHKLSVPTSVADAISDLPPVENGGKCEDMAYSTKANSEFQRFARKGSKRVFNHSVKALESINMKRVKALGTPGMNWTDLPSSLVPKNLKRMKTKYGAGVGAKTRFARLRWDGLFSTIVTSPDPYWGAFIHPEQDRVISVREAARAQSFPDRVRFSGRLKSQYRQVGNAVPVLLAEALGRALLSNS